MKMSNKTTISYTFLNTMIVGILTIIVLAIFIPIIFLANLEWWTTLIFIILCLGMIYVTIDAYIMDYSITFDYQGFIIFERNRVTSKEKIKSYKWDDISNLTITGLYSTYTTPILIISFKNASSDWVRFNGLIYTNKFIKLARHYSGRENIIKPSSSERKRKGLYQKDW